MDFDRARKLMADESIGALLVVGPENVSYITGAPIGPVHMWRSFGPYLAVVPSDPKLPIISIVADSHQRIVQEIGIVDEVRTHPAWIEHVDITDAAGGSALDRIQEVTRTRRMSRPEQFDLDLVGDQLRNVLQELSLSHEKIAVEFDDLRYSDMIRLRGLIPHAELSDSSALFRELRAVKSPTEQEHLRLAVKLTELGIMSGVKAAKAGVPISEIALAYREGVTAGARQNGIDSLQGSWDIISIGDRPWSNPTKSFIEDGDLLKFDCGCTINGLTSDMGRTFVVGKATNDQYEIYEALRSGMNAACESLEPGRPCSDVFVAAETAVRKNGLPSYTRGHFGHSIGSYLGHEEWPWLSRTESRLVETNMVFAVETPYYVDGVGGFMLEHDVIVREDGLEFLDNLPDTLAAIN